MSPPGAYAEPKMQPDAKWEQQRSRLVNALVGAGQGREACLREVYDLTSAKLFGICLRILGDRQDAEDVLQEVYVTVWRRAAMFEADRSSPITWLSTLARNRAIDRLRSRRRQGSAEPVEAAFGLADPSPGALAGLETAEDRGRLVHCIEELEQRSADAIRNAFFAGLTYSELADRAGVPLGTMKSWIRRALMKLKACLDQ